MSPKTLRRVLLVVLLGLLASLGCYLWLNRPAGPEVDPIDAAIEQEREKFIHPADPADPEPQPNPDGDTSVTEDVPLEVDFALLQQVNPHICAWLDIPGSYISYPVLLHDSDNNYYLNHAENGKTSHSGALFMEDYNSRDCSDPALVIYGHHLKSGAYFGGLQRGYDSPETFASHRTVRLYLPDRVITYRVFAAVPYSNTHLLYTYQFSNEYDYRDFVERIASVRSLSGQIDKDALPEPGQQLLILSTCLQGDNTRRFLVVAAEEEMEEK